MGDRNVPARLFFRRKYGRSDLAVCTVVSNLERLAGRSVTEGERQWKQYKHGHRRLW